MKKSAPNLKAVIKQNLAPQKEIFLLVGSDVWDFYRGKTGEDGQGEGWKLLSDNTDFTNPQRYEDLPIILDERALENIADLIIMPEKHKIASVINVSGYFDVKTISNGVSIRHHQIELMAICENLAKNTAIKQLYLKNNLGELLEDLSAYIERIRSNDAVFIKKPEVIELNAEILEKSSANKVANHFLAEIDEELAFNKEQRNFYRFNGKSWDLYDEYDLHQKIITFFGKYQADYKSTTRVENITKSLVYLLPVTGKPQENLLAFNNGVLSKNTLLFLPHKKEYWLTSYNPVDFLENEVETPNFDKWLNFISYGKEQRKRALVAGLYMILNNRHEWQLTLELIGAPAGGKSIYLEVGQMLAGEENSVSVTLEILKEPKALDMILNKTFIYSSDQGKYVDDASMIKRISSGDVIPFNPKGKKAFNARVNAIIAIVSNELPIYKNDGGGMDRRRVIFPFDVQVSAKDRDENLIDKLRKEIAGIIKKIYAYFPTPKEAKEALEEQRKSNEAIEMKCKHDHILDFIREFDLLDTVSNKGLILGSNRGVPPYNREDIYNRLYWVYLLFCYIKGFDSKNILKVDHFTKEISQAFKTAGYSTDFQNRVLGGGFNYTNVIFRNRQETIQKWNNL